jgi:hypothetical protein
MSETKRVKKMPICELCGEEEEVVTKCKSCGKLFCEYCGVDESRMCMECLDEEDDEYDEDFDDEEDDEA